MRVVIAAGEQLDAARIQMAVSLGFHIVFACLGIGLPLAMLFAEWRGMRTGNADWTSLARRWAKAFAILFSVGAVSGTVLSLSLPLFWPHMMGRWGAVFGFPFALEGFAFFIEAIFLGIYLYGWEKLSPRAHLWAGVPVAVSGLASGLFVVAANAWMQTPEGFRVTADGSLADVSPWQAVFNRSMPVMTLHMLLAAYMVTGLAIAAVYAVGMLHGKRDGYHSRGLALGLVMGLLFAPLQVLVGDLAARVVADTQPAKLAAMEALWETQPRAPETIGGIAITSRQETVGAIEIPGLLSLMAEGDIDATVRGLDSFPADERPQDITVVHLAFNFMVGVGFGLLGLAVWALIHRRRRGGMPDGRLFLKAVVIAAPAAFLAVETGWMVTEIGRQPWIVQGYMRTSEAVTSRPGIWIDLAVTLCVYALLAVTSCALLLRLAKKPLSGGAT